MDDVEVHRRLLALSRSRGGERRYLRLGVQTIGLEGLDPALARSMERRWGGFLLSNARGEPACRVRLFRAGRAGWLPRQRGEGYRVEALNDEERRVIASYRFALCADGGSKSWRLALSDDPDEPADRVLENAVRVVAARLALEQGGFALHAAAVMREDRAYVLAGPSRSGKSTAVSLLSEAQSMGDDLAMLVAGPRGWAAPALPFDNSERIRAAPPEGLFAVAGVWRLFQAERTRVERPTGSTATASLMSCVAFPWLFPERAEALLERCGRLVADGRYAHLHFSRDGDIWTELIH